MKMDKAVSDMVTQFGGRAEFERQLAAYDYTESEFRALWAANEARDRLYDSVTAGVKAAEKDKVFGDYMTGLRSKAVIKIYI